jgi:hypothetical protein
VTYQRTYLGAELKFLRSRDAVGPNNSALGLGATGATAVFDVAAPKIHVCGREAPVGILKGVALETPGFPVAMVLRSPP